MINCERLISEVFKREPLWNSYNVLHRSAVATNTLWSEVAEILGVDCHSAKKKWKGLRDYYRTELKKMYGHKPGDTTINLSICSHQVSTWPYYEMLHFLKDSMLSYYIKPKTNNKEPVYPEEEFCQMELTEGSPGSPTTNLENDADPVVKLLTPREQQIKTDAPDHDHDPEADDTSDTSDTRPRDCRVLRNYHDESDNQVPVQTEVSLLPLPLNSGIHNSGIHNSGLHTLAEIANVADPALPKKTKRARFDKSYSSQMLEMERHKLSIFEKEAIETDDDDFLFLRSLLPDIKTLPRSRKLLIRVKMQEMVYNEISKLENEVNENKQCNM